MPFISKVLTLITSIEVTPSVFLHTKLSSTEVFSISNAGQPLLVPTVWWLLFLFWEMRWFINIEVVGVWRAQPSSCENRLSLSFTELRNIFKVTPGFWPREYFVIPCRKENLGCKTGSTLRCMYVYTYVHANTHTLRPISWWLGTPLENGHCAFNSNNILILLYGDPPQRICELFCISI